MSILWVDSRVGSKELVTGLRNQGIRTELTTLDAGDFAFTGHGPDGDCEVGIERKTLSDLVDSLRNGRLQGVDTEQHDSQLTRMLNTYDFVWLLVEGAYTTDKRGRLVAPQRHHNLRPVPGGFSEDTLNKALLSLTLRGGMLTKETANRDQSVRWIASCFRSFTDKAWEAHTTMRTPQRPSTGSVTPVSTFRDMVMRVPGIGLAASRAVELRCMIDTPDGPRASLTLALSLQLADWEELAVPTPAGPRKLGTSKAMKVLEELRKIR